MAERSRGASRKPLPAQTSTFKGPPERRGAVASGRIVKLLVGQGHGFIRLDDGRDIFFHRADVREGVAFNTLSVGDAVSFELLDDTVSGARAIRVRRRARRSR